MLSSLNLVVKLIAYQNSGKLIDYKEKYKFKV